MNENSRVDFNGLRFTGLLLLLIACGLGLIGRLVAVYLADAQRFPIHQVRVAATYEHVARDQLKAVLAKFLEASFFSLSVAKLQEALNALNWVDTVYVERVWPDTLKIKLVEKKPMARWQGKLMTGDGHLFSVTQMPENLELPYLKGPVSQQLDVLQVYQKLSNILVPYGLKAKGLQESDNLSWVLILDNGTKIYLGKKALESRLVRFCKAYPAVFAQRKESLARVDMRYPRGMAIQWKQQTEQ